MWTSCGVSTASAREDLSHIYFRFEDVASGQPISTLWSILVLTFPHTRRSTRFKIGYP